ncbi:hypothetical protein KFU94_71275 [Chloroflexi bacterium TSY]|nr:hypothetical protein [Chloroflexi bacterium TSY]
MNRYDYALVLVVHHIIADGWSARIFARELACLYEAYTGWFKIRFTLLIYRQKSI